MSVAEYDLTDFRHLPGQHDQSSHGRGSGSSDAGSGEPATGERVFRVVTRGLIDETWETFEPDSVHEISNAQRGVAKELAAASIASRMTVPVEDMVAEAEAARSRSSLYSTPDGHQAEERYAITTQPDDTEWPNVFLVGRRPEGGVEVHEAMNIVDWSMNDHANRFTRKNLLEAADADGVLREGLDDSMYLPRDAEWAVSGTPAATRMARESMAGDLVDTWARTSNDSHPRSLAIQRAAEDEFGMEGAAKWKIGKDWDRVDAQITAIDLNAKHGAVYRDFVRAQYDGTQADLAAEGITAITLHRGVKAVDGFEPPAGEGITVQVRPLSSWSYDEGVARSFGGENQVTEGVVMSATIPASQVLSIGRKGAGCLSEGEVVILGPTVEGVKSERTA